MYYTCHTLEYISVKRRQKAYKFLQTPESNSLIIGLWKGVAHCADWKKRHGMIHETNTRSLVD